MPRGGAGGARPPSYPAYYVALAGILLLLLLLCCYVLYFCITKINELSKSESLMQQPGPQPAGYPVQPAVRSGAASLAQLCQQPPNTGQTLDTLSGSDGSVPAQHAPTLDTQSSACSEPTLSTEASDAGPTLEPREAKLMACEVRKTEM